MKLPKALLHPIGTAENLQKRFLQNCISSAIFLSQTSVLLLKRLVNWLIVENIFSKFLQKIEDSIILGISHLSLMQKESNRPKMYFSLKLNTFAFFTTLRNT